MPSLLYGCQLQPKYKAPNIELPSYLDKYSIEQDKDIADKIGWWSRFEDPNLNMLIKETLEANADILTAMTNVSMARAMLTLSEADRLPNINIQGTAERTKPSKKLKASSAQKTMNTFNLATLLSYEIDLWGKVASSNKAARASLLAAENNKKAVFLTVTSEVATAYFNLLALDSQISITKKLIKIQEEIYKLNQNLLQSGISNGIILSQAESSLAITKSQLPPLQQQLQEQENAIKIMLGRSPKDIIDKLVERGKTIDNLPVPPIIPRILPSELLAQRPDICAAEQDLIAANAKIGVARAAYFPSLSLTGLLGLSSNSLSQLFNNSASTSQISGNLSGPIVDFGRVSSNVKIAKISEQQYMIIYQNTIKTAFQEVADSLSAQKTSTDNFNNWQQNELALERVMSLTKERYKHGNVDYITVLEAEQQFLQAMLSGIGIKLKRLTAAVNLFHALGGNWEDTMPRKILTTKPKIN